MLDSVTKDGTDANRDRCDADVDPYSEDGP